MTRFTRRPVLVFVLALLSLALPLRGEVRLPGFFNDHMVLQRQMPLPVWGWANAGEKVSVKLADQTASAVADAEGRWRVTLPAMEAGGPHTLTVQGANTLTVSDILVGEVWLCSGQSNMEWSVRASQNAGAEIAAANDPLIRHVKIPKRPSATPLDDLQAPWQVCSPDTAGEFTACGYFMARELRKELGVPIGLINSSWGGTRIEPWTPPEGFAAVAELKNIHEQIVTRTPGSPAYQRLLTDHVAATEKWLQAARQALEKGLAAEPNPAFPGAITPPTNHQEPLMLYNGMIHAMVGYPIRGAIWYQGESNHGEGMLYTEKKKALIGGWRKLWGIGDFAFHFVQIAPFEYGQEDPSVLAGFWEAQAAALQIPRTGMVVTSDIATLKDIHPPNKQDVGRRLALLALNRTYGKKTEDSGPVFRELKPEGARLRVTFDHAAGLKSRDGQPLNWFEVIGAGTGWEKADATIDGESVLLSSPKVPQPAAMRFAWHKLAEPNLANGAGLPASAFRAGEIPRPDFLGSVEEARGYELVYDLDLEKLGRSIRYDADHRSKITRPIDRIAYLVELQPANGPAQYVYASMDAFTQDLSKIGIPTVDSGARFQQKVGRLTVSSNVPGIVTGANLEGGNIEFWPNNYGPHNAAGISGASNDLFDFGDVSADPVDGYGCMQVHNHQAKQTLFAINRWAGGATGCDLGLGNSEGKTRDWTFTSNGASYASKRLRVLVKTKP